MKRYLKGDFAHKLHIKYIKTTHGKGNIDFTVIKGEFQHNEKIPDNRMHIMLDVCNVSMWSEG